MIHQSIIDRALKNLPIGSKIISVAFCDRVKKSKRKNIRVIYLYNSKLFRTEMYSKRSYDNEGN